MATVKKPEDDVELQETSQNPYTSYQESDLVRAARDSLNGLQNPGDYKSNWTSTVQSAIDAINNRTPFTYSANGDALYQNYKDQYIQGGRLAMQDTMGQAAAMTGGYGNSYAQQAGQQTYNAYLNKLPDKIPELYQIAYGRYQDEGQNLKDRYAIAAAMENQDYGRYQDALGQYNTDRGYYTDILNTERNFDYQNKSDAYNLAVSILQNGNTPSDDLLKAAGISAADAAALRKVKTTGGIGSGGGSTKPKESEQTYKTQNGSETFSNIVNAALDYMEANPNVVVGTESLDRWLYANGYTGESSDKFKQVLIENGARDLIAERQKG